MIRQEKDKRREEKNPTIIIKKQIVGKFPTGLYYNKIIYYIISLDIISLQVK